MAARASKIASPGTKRITFNGIVAVSDDFNRLRIILLDEGKDNKPDYSKDRLKRAAPLLTFENNDEVVCVVLPAHRRNHWLAQAKELRGQWVTVEATMRPFMIPMGKESSHGVALDLCMLSPLTLQH